MPGRYVCWTLPLNTKIDPVCNSFNENKCFLFGFIYLSNAFDTAGHKTLLQKLQLYGV